MTVPSVPTGMNTGVSTFPWAVVSVPRRADDVVSECEISNKAAKVARAGPIG